MSALDRRVFDALPVAVCTTDLDGRLTSANPWWPRFTQAMGGSPGDGRTVVGTSIRDALAAGGARESVEHAMGQIRAGRAQSMSWEISTPGTADGRTFLLQVAPLHADHSISSFVVAATDVTGGRATQDSMADAGLSLARNIDVDEIVRDLGQQARRALGADAVVIALADDEGSGLRVRFGEGVEGDVEQLARTLEPAWSEAAERPAVVGRTPGGTWITTAMPGTHRTAGMLTVLTDADLSPQRVAEIVRLLTFLAAQGGAALERAGLAGRARRTQRLEAMGELSAGLAHELRNPLFGISSAAQLLRFRTHDDPVIEKNVGRILREVERLNRMTSALLEFGKPGGLTLARADPDAVWDQVLEDQRGKLESRSLAVRWKRADPPARCRIDADRLATALGNALSNAIDAAVEASDLSLMTTRARDGGWRCRLRNGGQALEADVVSRAFDVFYSGKPGGTGMGLAIARRIVEEHGGSMTLESTTDVGTEVTIALPGESSNGSGTGPA